MISIVQRLSQTVTAAQTLSAFTRPLLKIMIEVTELESAYLTTVDEARGVQNVLYSLNTSQMNIPEGLEVPWNDTLCKRALEEGRGDGQTAAQACAAASTCRPADGRAAQADAAHSR